MIWVVGYIVYVLVFLSYFFLPAIKGMIDQAIELAPEITFATIILFMIPLMIFSHHIATKRKLPRHKKLLYSQSVLCSSLAVSLGLIGTFVGLTDMVSFISGSMTGEGSISEKMGSMIGAISNALSAMSYAFLTSILGVGVSVLILLSINFFGFYYTGQDHEEHQEKKSTDDSVELLKEISNIKEINVAVAEKLVSIPVLQDVNTAYLEIFNSQDSKLTQQNEYSKLIFDATSEIKDREALDAERKLELLKNLILINETTKDGLVDLNSKVEMISSLLEKSQNELISIANTQSELMKEIVNVHNMNLSDKQKMTSRVKKALEVFFND